MSDLDHIPPELTKLYEAERVARAPAAATRAAVRAKLTASVGTAPLGHAAAVATLGTTGKVLATLAIVAGIGGATSAIVHAVRRAPVTSKAVAPSAPAATPAAPREQQLPPVVRAPDPPAPPVPPAAPAARPTAAARPMPSQPELLRDAWRALSVAEPSRALDLVESDARAHPDGSLAEEREALRVIALSRLDRGSDAATAARQFFERYPNSMYGDRVRRAMTNKETP
jgi:hypothetical protein